MSSVLIRHCVERFLSWCQAKRRPRTVAHYRFQLAKLTRKFGSRRLGELSIALLDSFSQSCHLVQSVQRLCRWCHLIERSIASNPLQGMAKPKTGRRRRVLSSSESARLFRAADPTFRAFLLVLRESMCRPQEARALEWGWVETQSRQEWSCSSSPLSAHFFLLPTAKGFELRADQGAERIIPISPRLARLLGRLSRRGVTLTDVILRDSKGRAWTANAVRCRFRRLRVRAGLVADRRGEKVVAYTLRHTGATNAAAAGVRDFRLAALLGHASPRTTERYVHLRPADLIDAAKVAWEAKPARKPKNDAPSSLRTRPDDLG